MCFTIVDLFRNCDGMAALTFPTGEADTDANIMLQLSDVRLNQVCVSNKYLAAICASREFWRRKLSEYYKYPFPMVDLDYRNMYKTIKRKSTYDQLVDAIPLGSLDLVTAIYNSGVDIRRYDDDALSIASAYGFLPIVEFLVDHGALVNVNALKIAARHGRLEVVKYLVAKEVDVSEHCYGALQEAAVNGHLDLVKFLVANMSLVDDGDPAENALGAAAVNGDLPMVEFLVDIGVDPRSNGDYAVQRAVNGGSSRRTACRGPTTS